MKRAIQKFYDIMKAAYLFLKEAVKFITQVVVFVGIGIGFWFVLGLMYVGSAKFVGEWLKLVVQYMN